MFILKKRTKVELNRDMVFSNFYKISKDILWKAPYGVKIKLYKNHNPYTFKRNPLDVAFLSTILNKKIIRTTVNIFENITDTSIHEVVPFKCSDYIYITTQPTNLDFPINDSITLLDIFIKYATKYKRIEKCI